MPAALAWHDEPDPLAVSVSVPVTAPLAVRVPDPPAAELVGGADVGAVEEGAVEDGPADDGAVDAVDEPLELDPQATQIPATIRNTARRTAPPAPEADMT